MTEPNTLADALPAEIERVQKKMERWKEYAKDPNMASLGFAIQMMQMQIKEGIDALASDDVARMIRAYESLKGNSNDD